MKKFSFYFWASLICFVAVWFSQKDEIRQVGLLLLGWQFAIADDLKNK